MPYYDILIEEIAGADLIYSQPRTNGGHDPALVRAEAYALIGEMDDYRFRDYLIRCLQNETDTYALSRGFEALGSIGVDYDGRSVRLISDKTQQYLPDDRLALSAVLAIKSIMEYNGYMTDQSGFFLLDSVMRSRISPEIRDRIFQIYKSFF
jgi:hypothetical protein